jgi:hypothetical protein
MLRQSVAAIAFVCCATAAAQSVQPPKVVAPDKLARYWVMLNSSIEADVPNYARGINVPGCATVSFIVEKDGHTSAVKVQRVVPEGDLRKIAMSVATGMRFEATPSNAGKDRVFSWLIFPFNLPDEPAARSAVMQKCAVDKLDWKDH